MTSTVPYETTLQIRDRCICLRVQRAARSLARRFDEAFRPLNLTHGQFSLLMSLNQPAPPTMGLVAQFLSMNRTTLTAAIKPLERRGLVVVTIDGADRRNRRLQLSKLGEAALAEAIPIWQATHAAVEQALVGVDQQSLRTTLGLL